MNVYQDELFHFLLGKCMVLEANVIVLTESLRVLMNTNVAGSGDEYAKHLPSFVRRQFEDLLVDHPYGDISEITDLIYPSSPPPEDD